MKPLAAAGLLSLCLLSGTSRSAEGNCGDWSALVLSTEGTVEIRPFNQNDWTALFPGDAVCLGDSVRTLSFSRAALRLPNETVTRVDAGATLTFHPPDDDNRTLLELLRGVISIISRDPRALKIATPYANAGLEGTEFLIGVSAERLNLIVYEGEVVIDAQAGTLSVGNGQSATVDSSGDFGPTILNTQDRADLLWSLHYQRILSGALPAPDQETAGGDADFLALRAQSRMLVGRTALAREDIFQALAIDAGNPEAHALQAMIAFAEGDIATATDVIERTLADNPESAALLVAQTYLLVHANDLRQALAAAESAVESEPMNAVAHTRRADALLAMGDVRSARLAAELALSIDAGLSPAHTALGFSALANGERTLATEHFQRAIRLDSAAALPRLGLAIALNRAGNSTAGRVELETAVVLDANDSIVRSYMGKAYSDEFRGELSATQLDIAKELGDRDATPQVYRAVFGRERNEPVAAIRDLAEAAGIDSRPLPLRSSLLADEDLVTRSTGLGKIYRSVGFEELALLAGNQAIIANPSEAHGHRLVADVYSEFPRFEMVRTSETYQARMLQPINVLPFAPQLSQINLSVASSIGPADLAHTEARSGFARNGLSFLTSAVTAGNGTAGEHAVVSGLSDNFSFNVGQFHLQTDGFRENNDFEHNVLSAFIQTRPSNATSLQFELRTAETEKGDIELLFDPDEFDSSVRQTDAIDLVRFGVSHRVTPWTKIVGSIVLDRSEIDADSPPVVSLNRLQDKGTVELQVLNELPHWNLISGLRLLRANNEETSKLTIPLPSDPFVAEMTETTRATTRHLSAYLYATRNIGDRLFLTGGASIDRLDGQQFDENQSNPKFGLTWHPLTDTYFRVAYFQTLQGPLLSKQLNQPSLEPMQVGGFGQYIFGVEAESAKNYAVALDHALAPTLRFGMDFRERSVDVPVLYVMPPSPDLVRSVLDVRESIAGIRLHWTPSTKLAFNAGWRSEDFDYHGSESPYGFSRSHTKRIPLEASIFISNAIGARLSATHIHQKGRFRSPDAFASLVPGQSRFWVVDASMNYRLPNRLGTVEVGIKNLLDKEFRFQDTDPENPHVFPERLLFSRISLSF